APTWQAAPLLRSRQVTRGLPVSPRAAKAIARRARLGGQAVQDPGAPGTDGFVHAALFYRTPADFTAGVLPYVEAGAARQGTGPGGVARPQPAAAARPAGRPGRAGSVCRPDQHRPESGTAAGLDAADRRTASRAACPLRPRSRLAVTAAGGSRRGHPA